MTSTYTGPRVLGVPGGGLDDASWLRGDKGAAKIGKSGEVRTAGLLDKHAAPANGVTVLHDLMVPSSKYKANIDHVVVSGRTVHLIDAKVWKPGRYWTMGGKTRRGFERFEPAEKQTMDMAARLVAGYLDSRGLDAEVALPVVVVWPSSQAKPLRLGMLRIPGARALTAERFETYADKQFGTPKPFGLGGGRAYPADARIVGALSELLVARHTPKRASGW